MQLLTLIRQFELTLILLMLTTTEVLHGKNLVNMIKHLPTLKRLIVEILWNFTSVEGQQKLDLPT